MSDQETGANEEEETTVQLGREDLILAIIIVILLIGYARGQLTIQEFLAYFGVTTTGGVWGLIGGLASSQ